ncbi:MAG TPA: hypothetical protein VFV39_06970 [Limnobacter sp.]|nr:hypothetical protein [Limnobacter sp.]
MAVAKGLGHGVLQGASGKEQGAKAAVSRSKRQAQGGNHRLAVAKGLGHGVLQGASDRLKEQATGSRRKPRVQVQSANAGNKRKNQVFTRLVTNKNPQKQWLVTFRTTILGNDATDILTISAQMYTIKSMQQTHCWVKAKTRISQQPK